MKRNYRVEPQSAFYTYLNAGDELSLSSADKCQAVEIVILDSNKHLAPELFASTVPVSPATQAQKQLQQHSTSAKKLAQQFDDWQIPLTVLQSAYCFSPNHFPSIKSDQDLIAIIIVAATDMNVTAQDTTTEIIIHRQFNAASNSLLPEPLADVKKEIYITHSTAEAYTVKEGEWIQIIDLEGKQCSDFLAFDQTELSKGELVGLDATATRTHTNKNLPIPGLHSKFFDANMLPMLELVQDTVGRHDSFLFACSPKFYEDAGYFGHISCSENFNHVLSSHNIKPRPAWSAINFFFNTQIEDCGTFSADEPWSRPNDYVLLKATRDLLCASSACPDDIDPANGWKPTDILVRIYSADCDFPRAITHRTKASEPSIMTKKSGFHPSISQLTTHLSEYKGYWVADEYTGWGTTAEYLGCRERVAMLDLSPLRKFEVIGPDAEKLLNYALTRNIRKLAVGAIFYTAMCHKTGGMVDDGTLFRLGEQAFRWICGDPSSGHWLRKLADEKAWQVTVRESSDQIHNIAVQGPHSRDLLKKILYTPEHQANMDNLAWFHFTIGRLENVEGIPLMVSRTGYTGELGFEVWCHPDHAETLWHAVWEAGQEYKIVPLGFNALDTLRIEAGLIFANHEFCDETNPFEAGIGFTVPLKSKTEDFVGREAIAAQNPASRKQLRGLHIHSEETVHAGDELYDDRYRIGHVTSACYSPLLEKQIALVRLSPQFCETGTQVEIGKLDGQQKRISATVCDLPFYDPERTRIRS